MKNVWPPFARSVDLLPAWDPNSYLPNGHTNSRLLKWYPCFPPQIASPEQSLIRTQQLAEAGFYFNPTEGHPDNVTCYLCDKDLDGWEYEDNPAIEHLKHCPDCGWARITATQEVDDDRKHVEDPRGILLVEARLMTFGKKWWPHEDKKGWLPKMERVCLPSSHRIKMWRC